MIKRPAFATFLSVAICLSFVTAHAPVTATDPQRAVDAIFERFREAASPGCAVGVSRAGRPLLTSVYGWADIEQQIPIAPDTVFEAGSISKQFTAAAIILLARQGKLSFADDVRKYLLEIPKYGSRITIGHLLSHTSGLRDWGSVLEAAGRPRGSRMYSPADVLDIVRRQRHPNFQAGSEYLYNNTGYSLLPLIVERITGTSFTHFTRQSIFEPLEMRHTEWRDDFERVVARRAIAYKPSGGAFLADMPLESVVGHAGLLTTIGDLLIWNQALDSGKIWGRMLREEIERPVQLTSGRSIGYAKGVVVSKYGVPEISHSGSTAGYRSFLARYPDDRLSVALLCNAADINAPRLARQVADVFLPPSSLAPPAPPAARVDPPVLASRAGLFRNRRTNAPLTLTVSGGQLRSGTGERLIPLSASAFRFEGSVRRIEFTSGPGGEGVRLITDESEVVPLQRMKAADATPALLADYEGEYVSDEAEAAYTVTFANAALVLSQPSAASIELVPSYADTFTTSRGWVVRFIRDGRGRITTMSLGLPGVRDLRFANTGAVLP